VRAAGQPGELDSVRLRKNTLGVYRLDNDSGQHDDQAVALVLDVCPAPVIRTRRMLAPRA
jgi:hypothetical protein